MTLYPVIYDLDDNGEADGVHFFCCTGCRSQSPHKLPDASNYGDNPADVVPEGTQCETCGGLVEKPFVSSSLS